MLGLTGAVARHRSVELVAEHCRRGLDGFCGDEPFRTHQRVLAGFGQVVHEDRRLFGIRLLLHQFRVDEVDAHAAFRTGDELVGGSVAVLESGFQVLVF